MVGTNLCREANCQRHRLYAFPGERPLFCSAHREEGMVDVHNKRCEYPTCNKHPTYGEPGRRARFCSAHRAAEHIDVHCRPCEFEGCMKHPHYAFEGDRARFCAKHRAEGMVDVKHRRCYTTGCAEPRVYEAPGKKSRFCTAHLAASNMAKARRASGSGSCARQMVAAAATLVATKTAKMEPVETNAAAGQALNPAEDGNDEARLAAVVAALAPPPPTMGGAAPRRRHGSVLLNAAPSSVSSEAVSYYEAQAQPQLQQHERASLSLSLFADAAAQVAGDHQSQGPAAAAGERCSGVEVEYNHVAPVMTVKRRQSVQADGDGGEIVMPHRRGSLMAQRRGSMARASDDGSVAMAAAAASAFVDEQEHFGPVDDPVGERRGSGGSMNGGGGSRRGSAGGVSRRGSSSSISGSDQPAGGEPEGAHSARIARRHLAVALFPSRSGGRLAPPEPSSGMALPGHHHSHYNHQEQEQQQQQQYSNLASPSFSDGSNGDPGIRSSGSGDGSGSEAGRTRPAWAGMPAGRGGSGGGVFSTVAKRRSMAMAMEPSIGVGGRRGVLPLGLPSVLEEPPQKRHSGTIEDDDRSRGVASGRGGGSGGNAGSGVGAYNGGGEDSWPVYMQQQPPPQQQEDQQQQQPPPRPQPPQQQQQHVQAHAVLPPLHTQFAYRHPQAQSPREGMAYAAHQSAIAGGGVGSDGDGRYDRRIGSFEQWPPGYHPQAAAVSSEEPFRPSHQLPRFQQVYAEDLPMSLLGPRGSNASRGSAPGASRGSGGSFQVEVPPDVPRPRQRASLGNVPSYEGQAVERQQQRHSMPPSTDSRHLWGEAQGMQHPWSGSGPQQHLWASGSPAAAGGALLGGGGGAPGHWTNGGSGGAGEPMAAPAAVAASRTGLSQRRTTWEQFLSGYYGQQEYYPDDFAPASMPGMLQPFSMAAASAAAALPPGHRVSFDTVMAQAERRSSEAAAAAAAAAGGSGGGGGGGAVYHVQGPHVYGHLHAIGGSGGEGGVLGEHRPSWEALRRLSWEALPSPRGSFDSGDARRRGSLENVEVQLGPPPPVVVGTGSGGTGGGRAGSGAVFMLPRPPRPSSPPQGQ